nr:piggyBac transposable element-derived protein 3-like [Syngnathus scovelli]XP_049583035.1 piggyBac transposable element-derived protein 3-like [Syngnathus scovelli]XP_049583037.1 piggyBac transposable element-derived protein 3-like [Syngnathus scovelli]
MAGRKFLQLRQIKELVTDPTFQRELLDSDDETTIDIVELPPDSVDVVSDVEDIDEDDLGEQFPSEVPGHVEIHHSNMRSVTATETSNPTPKRKKTSESSWKKSRPDLRVERGNDTTIDARIEVIKNTFKDKTPVEVFETLFDEDIRSHIGQQSVIYAAQNNHHGFLMSDGCLKKLVGFFLLTGYDKLPQERMYWCEDEDIDKTFVRQCFSRNRYLELKQNLHFNDNSTLRTSASQKSFKIAPLIEMINQRFLMFGIFSKYLSIDEQMVQYYGHHFLKQFIRGKPIRFGFKNWVMSCSATGYWFDFDLYEGKKEDSSPVSGLGASVILNKVAKASNPSDHVFFFDNFVTSFELLKLLTEQEVSASGTVRLNRTNKCPLASEQRVKVLKKQKRGFIDYSHDSSNNIFAVVWKDNNDVKMSNH